MAFEISFFRINSLSLIIEPLYKLISNDPFFISMSLLTSKCLENSALMYALRDDKIMS